MVARMVFQGIAGQKNMKKTFLINISHGAGKMKNLNLKLKDFM